MHLNGVLLFKKYAIPYFKDSVKVLEIAPFGNPSNYKNIIANEAIDWYTLDVREDYIGCREYDPCFVLTKDAYNYPFDDEEFDVVLSDQVFAHVELFWIWMEELKRIAKKGGHIVTIASLSYPSCPSPVDCWRVYPDGMKALNKSLNLKTILSTCESLELEYFGYSSVFKKIKNFTVPLDSIASTNNTLPQLMSVNRMKIGINRILIHIPILRRFMPSVHIAYDTITIAQK